MRFFLYTDCSTGFNLIFMKLSKIKGGNTCIQAHPTEDIYNVYISFFYLFCETAHIASFSWMKYGTEQILFFSTKLWYKLAQFSILLLINLTGAQFVN